MDIFDWIRETLEAMGLGVASNAVYDTLKKRFTGRTLSVEDIPELKLAIRAALGDQHVASRVIDQLEACLPNGAGDRDVIGNYIDGPAGHGMVVHADGGPRRIMFNVIKNAGKSGMVIR